MDFFNIETISYLISILLGVGGSFFGFKYVAIKNLIKTIYKAAKDDKITPDEVQAIILSITKLKS